MTRTLRVEPSAVLRDFGAAGAMDAALRDGCRRLILPLDRADAERGSDLRATLRAYYANGCSVAQTAEALFMHRNSVRYRLDRIRSVLRLDIEHHEVAAALLLAMIATETGADEAQRAQ